MTFEDYPVKSYDKLRYGDTDRQGHINNAVYATFYETGRIEALQAAGLPLLSDEFSIVTARITIDYVREVFWPGTVEIGTAIKAVGRSSMTLHQALFQNGVCVSTADSVVVLVSNTTHRSTPIAEAMREKLQSLILVQAP
jgi:acyl-CoA thioester hydrolase